MCEHIIVIMVWPRSIYEIYTIIYYAMGCGIEVTLIGIIAIRYNNMHIGTFPFSGVCGINLVIGTVRGSGPVEGEIRIRASTAVSRLVHLLYFQTESSIVSFTLTSLSNNYKKKSVSHLDI